MTPASPSAVTAVAPATLQMNVPSLASSSMIPIRHVQTEWQNPTSLAVAVRQTHSVIADIDGVLALWQMERHQAQRELHQSTQERAEIRAEHMALEKAFSEHLKDLRGVSEVLEAGYKAAQAAELRAKQQATEEGQRAASSDDRAEQAMQRAQAAIQTAERAMAAQKAAEQKAVAADARAAEACRLADEAEKEKLTALRDLQQCKAAHARELEQIQAQLEQGQSRYAQEFEEWQAQQVRDRFAMKQQQSQVAVKAMGKLIVSNTAAMLREAFNGWRLEVESSKKASIEAEKFNLLQRQQKTYNGALGCWAKSSTSVLRKSTFNCWLVVIRDGKNERLAKQAEKANRSAMAMKMLQQTASADAMTYTKTCFLAWVKLHGKGKQSKTTMKALARFSESQADGQMRLVFSAWAKDLEELKLEGMEADRRRMADAQKGMADAQKKQFAGALGSFAKSSAKVLKKSTFMGWVMVIIEEMELREKDQDADAMVRRIRQEADEEIRAAREEHNIVGQQRDAMFQERETRAGARIQELEEQVQEQQRQVVALTSERVSRAKELEDQLRSLARERGTRVHDLETQLNALTGELLEVRRAWAYSGAVDRVARKRGPTSPTRSRAFA